MNLRQAPRFPYSFIDHMLFSEEEIHQRVQELAAQITEDYKHSEKLLLIGLLRGSVMFITDLMRAINLPMSMDFMSVSSYAGSNTTGFIRIDSDHKTNIAGWDVILVDDIADSGNTLYTIKKLLLERHPKSLKLCALLDKEDRRKVNVEIDYRGFVIPDYFVVGYGLDCDEKGRNLPYIASVNFERFQAEQTGG